MWRKGCTVLEKSVAKGMCSCGKKCGERDVQFWKKVWRKVCTIVEKKCGKRYVQLWKKVWRKVCVVVEKSVAKGMYSCQQKCCEWSTVVGKSAATCLLQSATKVLQLVLYSHLQKCRNCLVQSATKM